MTGAVPRVQLDQLHVVPADPEHEGGDAVVRRVQYQNRPAMLKRYHEQTLEELDEDALGRLVVWPQALPAHQREFLLARTAWPLGLVLEQQKTIGVLLPRAAPRFLELRHGDLQPRHATVQPRHATRMTRQVERACPPYRYFEAPQKLARLGELMVLMQFLHGMDVVISDLQDKNVLVTDPESVPGVLLLDCDTMLIQGCAALPAKAPDHMVAGGGAAAKPSVREDYRRFGLLAVHVLAESNRATGIERTNFLAFLRDSDVGLLERTLAGDLPPSDVRAWTAAGRSWPRLASTSVRLWVRTDKDALVEWRRRAPDWSPSPADPEPASEPPVLPRPVAPTAAPAAPAAPVRSVLPRPVARTAAPAAPVRSVLPRPVARTARAASAAPAALERKRKRRTFASATIAVLAAAPPILLGFYSMRVVKKPDRAAASVVAWGVFPGRQDARTVDVVVRPEVTNSGDQPLTLSQLSFRLFTHTAPLSPSAPAVQTASPSPSASVVRTAVGGRVGWSTGTVPSGALDSATNWGVRTLVHNESFRPQDPNPFRGDGTLVFNVPREAVDDDLLLLVLDADNSTVLASSRFSCAGRKAFADAARAQGRELREVQC